MTEVERLKALSRLCRLLADIAEGRVQLELRGTQRDGCGYDRTYRSTDHSVELVVWSSDAKGWQFLTRAVLPDCPVLFERDFNGVHWYVPSPAEQVAIWGIG